MSILTHLKFILQSGIGSVFQILVAIIRTKVIATTLGAQGVGILGQLADLSQIQSILVNLGYSSAAITEISNARGKNDIELVHKVRSALLNLTIFNSIIITIVSVIFAKQISIWLFGNADFSLYIQIVSISVIAIGVNSAYSTFLAADKLIKNLMIQNIVGSSIAGAVIVFLVLYDGIRGAVIGITVNAFIGVLINAKFLRDVNIPLYIKQIGNFRIEKKLLRLFLSFTVITLLTSISIRVSNLYVKRIIISYGSLEEAGLFQAALSISNQYLPILLGAIATYLLPHLSETTTFDEMKQETLVALRTVLLLSFPFLSGLMLFSHTIIHILYSKEFTQTGYIVSITVFGDLIIILAKVLVNVFMTRKMFLPWLVGDIVLSLAFPVLVYILYPIYGLNGVAVGYNLALFSVLICYLIVLWKIGFTFSIQTFLLITLFTVLLGFLFFVHSYTTSLLNLLVAYIICNTLFYLFSIKKTEIEQFLQKVRLYLQKNQ